MLGIVLGVSQNPCSVGIIISILGIRLLVLREEK